MSEEDEDKNSEKRSNIDGQLGDLNENSSKSPEKVTFGELEVDSSEKQKIFIPGRYSIMTTGKITLGQSTTDWNSIRLIAVVIFIVRIQNTVYFGSLKQMIYSIDPQMDNAFFGNINSLYNLGLAISGPIFGLLANKYGFLHPVLLAYCMCIFCNIGYILLFNIPNNGRFYALSIRFISGIAAGGTSILNTYWASVCASKDATTAATYTDAARSLGQVFGPVLQLICMRIPDISISFLHINKYTVPAMIAIVLSVLASIMLVYSLPKDQKPKHKKEETTTDEDEEKKDILPLNYFALIVCFGITAVQQIFFANVETNNPSFIAWMFDYTQDEITNLHSALIAGSGLIGFGFLVCYVWTGFAKKVNNRIGVIIGCIICLAYLLGTFSYPSYSGFIQNRNCTYSWCSTTTTVPLPLYIIVFLITFSIGFPLLNVHASSLLAKQLAGRKQAHWHGFSKFVSTASRVAASSLMARSLEYEGFRFVWYLQIGLVLPTILTIVLSYNWLGTPSSFSPLHSFKVIIGQL